MLQENCYVVSDDTKECVIIDCGAYYEEEKLAIEKYIKENGLTPKHLIATHGHLDHNFGDAFITSTFGIPLEIDSSDEEYVKAADKQAALFGMTLDEPIVTDIKTFHAGEHILFGNHDIEVIETPGHSMWYSTSRTRRWLSRATRSSAAPSDVQTLRVAACL